jgi:hypothetical protein
MECIECQLMKKPDPIFDTLTPMIPPQPLTKWAIDHTFWNNSIILVMMEYATNWVKAVMVSSRKWEHIFPMLNNVINWFGAFNELISNNAKEFLGNTAKKWHLTHKTKVWPITSIRPRGNSKVKKTNGSLKKIALRKQHTNPAKNLSDLIRSAVRILNRTPNPSGYSLYFLMYGTSPPEHSPNSVPQEYTKEYISKKEDSYQRKLAKHHEAPQAR